MDEVSATCQEPICKASGVCICSEGLGAGPTLWNWQDGRKRGPAGPDLARANRSRQPGKGKRKRTLAISGRKCSGSSASADLQQCLENRLRAALDVNGSPECVLTWKHWDMQSGPPICALRGRQRRTSDSAYSGWQIWPTTKAKDGREWSPGTNRESVSGHGLGAIAQLTIWPTTRGTDGDKGIRTDEGAIAEFERKGTGADLPTIANLAVWPTAMAGTPATETYNEAGNTDSGRKTVSLVSGLPSTSSTAQTGKRGVLNPEHSRWLQGYPVAWGFCGATAIVSCHRSRRPSSKRTSNQNTDKEDQQ
jgi:hypothetical protein